MPDPQVFKATYSGVPVYEMMVKSIAVMRRRADGWLNATQILKVAGFDKPQRTRILEREVQKGEHEKVQGGYGKYQGTWVPPDRGLSLARQYNCENLIRMIVDFVPNDRSPPPAPKHVNAAPSKPPRREQTQASNVATRSSGRRPAGHTRSRSPSQRSGDDSFTASPSASSASSRTPSPIQESISHPLAKPGASTAVDDAESSQKKRKTDHVGGKIDIRTYSNQILEYFVSDSTHIPKFLINPPTDYDPNLAIDDDGHTALHWASAMGRLKVVKQLLTAGADVFRVNKTGQTALMRSVMFSNNYDIRKFGELYELLHRSTLNIDNSNKTVFHHIVDVAMSKGKTHAARYYMEIILHRLAEYPTELADIINFQDEDGETALTLAARCRSKRLVKLLIDHGADPKLTNRDGKSAEDYILEDERFRLSPPLPTRQSAVNARANVPAMISFPGFARWHTDEHQVFHHSAIAQRASSKVASEISTLLDSLSHSFDFELLEKERDLNQAHALLVNIDAEIIESQRTITLLQEKASTDNDAVAELQKLEATLCDTMSKRHRLGWEKWNKDEELREKDLFDQNGGMKASDVLKDVVELHSNLASNPVVQSEMCANLRNEIERLRQRRRDGFESFVKQQAEAGTGAKMNEYKRLIAAGCGNISPGEVEALIPSLLQAMQSDELGSTATESAKQASSAP